MALDLSAEYLLGAPVGALLDQMSLLTDRQHVSLLIGALAVLLAWRLRHVVERALGTLDARRRIRRRSLARELAVGGAGFGSLLGVYAFGVLGSRPMAAIEPTDPEFVVVDFHSHTEASHDGRAGLDIDVRRAWHRDAGFDLLYVTDHSVIEPALNAALRNPSRAGDDISLLPGREVRYRRQHVIALGVTNPNDDLRLGERWPTLIQTLPNDLSRVPVPDHGRHGGVHAIELIDGDPRALRQTLEERERILAIADSLDLALVAGGNHHGWGRAAAAWTLVRVPGWRELSPPEVGRLVEAEIRRGRASGARVVERARLPGGTTGEPFAMSATTLPRLAVHILRTLTVPERLAWLGWIAALSVVLVLRSNPSARRPA